MYDNSDLSREHEILGYWIDYKLKKAYCIIRFLDVPEDDKHTNIFFTESDYTG